MILKCLKNESTGAINAKGKQDKAFKQKLWKDLNEATEKLGQTAMGGRPFW